MNIYFELLLFQMVYDTTRSQLLALCQTEGNNGKENVGIIILDIVLYLVHYVNDGIFDKTLFYIIS